jgi:hypothetical protein
MTEPSTNSQAAAAPPTSGFVASLSWYAVSRLGQVADVVGFLLLLSGLLGLGMAAFKTQSWLTQGQLIGLAFGALAAGAAALHIGSRARKSARLKQALESMSPGSRLFVLLIQVLLLALLQFAGALLMWPSLKSVGLFVTGGLTLIGTLCMTVALWPGRRHEE